MLAHMRYQLNIACMLLAGTYDTTCAITIMQCVTITSCGNFAIIGMNTGHVEMFNMQSGIHRGEFGKPRGLWLTRICSCEYEIETWRPLSSVAHARPVRGIAVDGLNMEVISASSDCTVKVYTINVQILKFLKYVFYFKDTKCHGMLNNC